MNNGFLGEHYCLYCQKKLIEQTSWTSLFNKGRGRKLCKECESQLVEIQGKTCKICSRPLERLDSQFVIGDMCHDCYRWEQDKTFKNTLDKNISLYLYNDFMKELISRFKYRGDYILAQIFSHKLQETLQKLLSLPASSTQQRVGLIVSTSNKKFHQLKLKPRSLATLVPIPLSAVREWERGFNQAEALIVEAGFTAKHLLKRIHSEKQSKKSRIERIQIPQVFLLANERDLTGETIILVDDIYTTGSTLRHAAKVLKDAGAKIVISITVAR